VTLGGVAEGADPSTTLELSVTRTGPVTFNTRLAVQIGPRQAGHRDDDVAHSALIRRRLDVSVAPGGVDRAADQLMQLGLRQPGPHRGLVSADRRARDMMQACGTVPSVGAAETSVRNRRGSRTPVESCSDPRIPRPGAGDTP
jgi:hypothetical protein